MKMVDNRECFRQLNLMAARGWVASKPAVNLARCRPHLYTNGHVFGRDRVLQSISRFWYLFAHACGILQPLSHHNLDLFNL